MQTKIIERYFFFSLLFITLVLSFFIFRPFWTVLMMGISFSVVLFPIYQWLNKKLPNWLSALITVLLFVFVILILLFSVGFVVFKQSMSVYNFMANSGSNLPFIDSANNSINKLLPGISFDLHEKISSFLSFLTDNLANIFTATLSTIFAFFLTFMSMFYFLKDSAKWKRIIITISPLSEATNEKIISKLSQSINGIIKGNLFIVFIQGILVGIGFAIFGVPNPALWGLVAMIAAFVPTVGSGLVSIPAILFLFFTGHLWNAFGLLVWAVALVGTIDNILNPFVIGSRIKLPPLLILFSVLGGISLWGPVGVLAGPLIISLFYTLISIYREEFRQPEI